MPRGSSPKREREYVELKTEFEREKRYPGREAEVASRIVNKQRAERGEAKSAGGTGTAPKASSSKAKPSAPSATVSSPKARTPSSKPRSSSPKSTSPTRSTKAAPRASKAARSR